MAMLLGFNLGVEAGRLALVLTLVPCLTLLRRLAGSWEAQLHGLAGAAIATAGGMWLAERALAPA